MIRTIEHGPISAAEPAGSIALSAVAPAPVSRVSNAAYVLERCSMSLLWASTPTAKAVAQREYDAACADMLALLTQSGEVRHG